MGRAGEVAAEPRGVRAGLTARLVAIRVRAFIAVNAGLLAGYALVLARDLASPDIIAATDFTVFWGAWHQILHGGAALLYDEATQRATQRLLMHGGYFEGGLMAFLNPPHAALATVPFGWLADHAGEPLAFAAWTAANCALLFLLIRTLLAEWGPAPAQQRRMLVVATLAFYPLFVAIKNGQPSLVLALAVIGVWRATRDNRPWAAGAWLTVLTVKPQLLPFVVIFLVAHRSWRVLQAGAILTAGVVAVTSLALGPTVWLEYLRHVHYLEQFWGTGTPDYMLNLRGALMRIAGLDRAPTIDVVAYIVWLTTMALSAALVYMRTRSATTDWRPIYALLIALGLFANPHLFIHDTLIWVVPLLLCAASIRDEGGEWRRFALFALAWPMIFAVAGRLDIRSGPLTWFDLHTWTFVAALVAIGHRLPGGTPQAAPAGTSRLQAAQLYRSWTS
jgi:hypothetical protein